MTDSDSYDAKSTRQDDKWERGLALVASRVPQKSVEGLKLITTIIEEACKNAGPHPLSYYAPRTKDAMKFLAKVPPNMIEDSLQVDIMRVSMVVPITGLILLFWSK